MLNEEGDSTEPHITWDGNSKKQIERQLHQKAKKMATNKLTFSQESPTRTQSLLKTC
jgi:hypothetical protein